MELTQVLNAINYKIKNSYPCVEQNMETYRYISFNNDIEEEIGTILINDNEVLSIMCKIPYTNNYYQWIHEDYRHMIYPSSNNDKLIIPVLSEEDMVIKLIEVSSPFHTKNLVPYTIQIKEDVLLRLESLAKIEGKYIEDYINEQCHINFDMLIKEDLIKDFESLLNPHTTEANTKNKFSTFKSKD